MAKSTDHDEESGAAVASTLERLARLMRASEHDGGLNPAQWEALRYIGRANRFSNSPGALTRYLGATKGTVSQTLISLEKKGFIAKSGRPGERRSVVLALTPKGEKALLDDPWRRLARLAEGLGGKTRRRLAKGLGEMLADELKQGGGARFGSCPGCRYFRQNGRSEAADGPHLCMLMDAPLSQVDTQRICVMFEAA